MFINNHQKKCEKTMKFLFYDFIILTLTATTKLSLSLSNKKWSPIIPTNISTSSEVPSTSSLTDMNSIILNELRKVNEKLEKLNDKINSNINCSPQPSNQTLIVSQSKTAQENKQHCFDITTNSSKYGSLLQILKLNNSNDVDYRKLIELRSGHLAAITLWNQVFLWNLTSGQCEKNFALNNGRSFKFQNLQDTILLPNENEVATIIYGEPIQLWDFKEGKILKNFSANFRHNRLLLLNDFTLASIDYNYDFADFYRINIWNTKNGTFMRSIKLTSFTTSPYTGINAFVLLPNGNIAVGERLTQSIQIWNPQTSQLVRILYSNFTANKGFVRYFYDAPESSDLAVLPNGRHLAFASTYGIVIWDLETGVVVRMILYEYKGFNRLVTMQNGLLVSASDSTRVIKIWNPNDGKLVKTIGDEMTKSDYEHGGIYALVVLRNGNLATGVPSARTLAEKRRRWS